MDAHSLRRTLAGGIIPNRECLDAVTTDWLQHDDLSRRIFAAVGIGLGIMFAAWALSYLFLPEAVLRGRTGAGVFTSATDAVLSTFAQALLWNAVAAFVFVPLVSLLAVGPLSLGYVYAFGNFALFGVFLGTNSFSVPNRTVSPPGLDVFLGTGPWEISAYAIVAAVVANRSRWRQLSWLGGKVERVDRAPRPLTRADLLALAAAAVLIVGTAWAEHLRVG